MMKKKNCKKAFPTGYENLNPNEPLKPYADATKRKDAVAISLKNE